MADGIPGGFIQVPVDSAGKKVDTVEITRADTTVVERQRFSHPDPIWVDGDVVRLVLVELRLLNRSRRPDYSSLRR